MSWQAGRSQLRKYKSNKKLVVSDGEEGEASQPKPKSQVLEFWLVREYCDKGSLSVCPAAPLRILSSPPDFSDVYLHLTCTFIHGVLLVVDLSTCMTYVTQNAVEQRFELLTHINARPL